MLQTLVAEVYGPDPARRLELAGQVKAVLEQTPGVVDVDWYVAAPQAEDVARRRRVARQRRRGHGRARVGSRPDGDRRAAPSASCTTGRARGRPDRSALAARRPRDRWPPCASCAWARTSSPSASSTREETRTEADSLYHKNLLPVTYVTGDLAGAAESPVYAILRMNERHLAA